MDCLYLNKPVSLETLQHYFTVTAKDPPYYEINNGKTFAGGVSEDGEVLDAFGIRFEDQLASVLKDFISYFPDVKFINEQDGYFEELAYKEPECPEEFEKKYFDKADKFIKNLIEQYE